MKLLFLVLALSLTVAVSAQTKSSNLSIPDSTKQIQNAEASCGQCNFHLKGKGCNLAVRINGKAYFVDGVDIDSFGDAHAKDGFCNAIS
ncbi:MAG: DUF6370 family protein [Bacteroidota bacterium]